MCLHVVLTLITTMSVITMSEFALFAEEFPELAQCYDINIGTPDDVDVDDYEYQQTLY